MNGEIECLHREIQFSAVSLGRNGGPIFRKLYFDGAGAGRHDPFRDIGKDLGVLALARHAMLDALEFLESAVVAVLIFDGSVDQGANLFGSRRGISADGRRLAAGLRTHRNPSGTLRQRNEERPERHDLFPLDHEIIRLALPSFAGTSASPTL